MTLTKTFPTDRAAGLPVADTRLINAGLIECNTAGVPRVGILPAHYNALVTGTAGMAYSVAAFNAVTSRSGNGVEFVANDGAVSVATTAAPGANSRIDVIWVRSLFTTYADGSSDPVFGVTQGTAAASPSKPSIPAGALELATAVVLSTTTQTSTAVITQTHPYTAMEGGAVALRSQAEIDAWAPADGSRAFRIDTGVEFTRRGGAWVRVPRIAYGTFIGNCEANGMVSLAHGLGVTPANVQISYGPVDGISPGDNPNARLFTPVIWDIGPSVIRVRMRREDTHVFLTESQFIAISWQAIA